jgi:hypothetical protein
MPRDRNWVALALDADTQEFCWTDLDPATVRELNQLAQSNQEGSDEDE